MSQDDESELPTKSHKQNGKRDANASHERDVDPLRRHVVDPPRGRAAQDLEEDSDLENDADESAEDAEDSDDGDSDDEPSNRQKKSEKKRSKEDDDSEDDSDRSDKTSDEKKKSQKDDDSDDDEDSKKEGQKSNPRGKIILAIMAVVLLVLLLAVGLPWYLHARHFESTDDAFVDSHWEKISPRVAGRVLHVNFDDNAYVEKGQVIVQIDPEPYKVGFEQQQAAVAESEGRLSQQNAQLLVAQAGVGSAQADVDRMTVTRDNAASELHRYEGLSAEAVSRQRLDDLRVALRSADAQLSSAQKGLESAKANVELAKSQITTAQGNVQSANAMLDNAKLQLSYTDVVAITAGRVTQRGVQDGDYVTPGQQMLNLVPTHVWVTANFKETQLTDMKVGQDVELEVDAYPDQTLHGKIESIQAGSGQWFSLLPPENATGNYVKVVQRVPVKITIDDTGSDTYKKLGPGMSVVPRVRVR